MFEETVGNGRSTLQASHGSGPDGEIHDGTFVPKDAIRLRAYQKWEAAGKPGGNGVEFLLEAERELSRSRSRLRRWWTHV